MISMISSQSWKSRENGRNVHWWFQSRNCQLCEAIPGGVVFFLVARWQDHIKPALIGLCRDLRGIGVAPEWGDCFSFSWLKIFFVGQVVKTSGLACTSCEPGASGNLCESFFGKRSSSDSFLMEENPSLWDWELGIGIWGNHCDVGKLVNLWTCYGKHHVVSQKRHSNSLVFLMRVWIFNQGVSAKLDAKDGGL